MITHYGVQNTMLVSHMWCMIFLGIEDDDVAALAWFYLLKNGMNI